MATASFTQEENLYHYNTIYGLEDTTSIYIPKPPTFVQNTSFSNRILGSDSKTTGESSDSWMNYLSATYIDVDSLYGDIKKLLVINKKLMFFQERAFGVVSVQDRATSASSEGELILGVSDTLDYYEYISTNTGIQDKKHILEIEDGIFWIDRRKKELYFYNGKLENITMTKNMFSWFKQNITTSSTILLSYDFEYKELYITVDSNNTLVYNTTLNQFVGFYTFTPTDYVTQKEFVLSSEDGNKFFLHNNGEKCLFYWENGGKSYSDSKVTILVNPNENLVNVFDKLEWMSEVYDGTDNLYDTTVDTIKVYNDYQSTADLATSTYATRRNRTWRMNTIRATVDEEGSALSRTDSRLKDSYIKIDITFNNTSDYRLILHDITTLYRLLNNI